jgi:hypothetical protein
MTQHLVPSPRPASNRPTPLRSPSPALANGAVVLDASRGIRFAQRLAVLIRRIQAHNAAVPKEAPSHDI